MTERCRRRSSEALDFTATANVPANALGEQQAFAEFLQEFHSTPETAYNKADTPITGDTRVQNLNFRDDSCVQLGAARRHGGG